MDSIRLRKVKTRENAVHAKRNLRITYSTVKPVERKSAPSVTI